MRPIIIISVLIALCSSTVFGQTTAGYTGLGSKAIERGNYTVALDYLNKAIEIGRFNSEAYFLRGYAKYELDDIVGAEKDFGEAIKLNPKNHEAYLYRGVSRSRLLRYKEAFEDFNKAVRLNDEDWRVYSNRALASLQLDRYVDVISDCNRIIKLKKENSQTYLLRGEAKAGLEMYKVAIEDFERAMKMDSMAMQPVLRRGVARLELEKFDLAIEDFNKALALDLENSLPIFYRGVALTKKGEYQRALNDFNIVLESYPDNEVVLFNRAMLFSDMNRDKLALSDYDQVVKLNPTNILARFNRGLLHLSQNRLTQALQDIDMALELFPEFIDGHEVKLQIIQQLGRSQSEYDKAEKAYNEVLSFIATSANEVKEEQLIRLMKLTKLKGDFEQMEQEVGKIQHQQVDVRLLPFYRVSPNPETDTDISVYDGFGRPFYNIGVITFTTKNPPYSIQDAKAVVSILELDKTPTTTEFIRSIPYYVYAETFDRAYGRLESCIEENASETACYFSRGYVRQVELEKMQDEHRELVGSLEVVDTVYEQQVEQLIAQIEADYRKVVELDNNMSFAHFNLAHVLATAERYEEAEVHFGLAASSRGNFIEANYNRGLIRLILGKTTKACEDLSLAGELGFTDAYNVINRYCE